MTTRALVQKYGGSSLAGLDRVRRVGGRIATAYRSGRPVVVVVSAPGDTTDDLLALASAASDVHNLREIDQLLATGECSSAAVMALVLQGQGIPAVSLTGPQAGVLATGKHGSGVITAVDTRRTARLLADGNVVVVAGFQGVNPDGDVITLGRGGSDTTAVAIAAELGAERCEIYSDVDGVYSADPRVVPGARRLATVDAGLMAEMSFAGAKVLYSRSVELAAMHRIEVHVRGSFAPGAGTVIPGGINYEMLERHGVIVAATHDLDVARVLFHSWGARHDLAADVLALLARNSVPIDLVARSGPHEDEFRMGFTIRRSDVAGIQVPLLDLAQQLGGGVKIDEAVGKVSLVGMGLLNRPEYTARMLAALSGAGIVTSWISTSQLRTSVTVPLDEVIHAINVLHREFGLDLDDVAVGSLASA